MLSSGANVARRQRRFGLHPAANIVTCTASGLWLQRGGPFTGSLVPLIQTTLCHLSIHGSVTMGCQDRVLYFHGRTTHGQSVTGLKHGLRYDQ